MLRRDCIPFVVRDRCRPRPGRCCERFRRRRRLPTPRRSGRNCRWQSWILRVPWSASFCGRRILLDIDAIAKPIDSFAVGQVCQPFDSESRRHVPLDGRRDPFLEPQGSRSRREAAGEVGAALARSIIPGRRGAVRLSASSWSSKRPRPARGWQASASPRLKPRAYKIWLLRPVKRSTK